MNPPRPNPGPSDAGIEFGPYRLFPHLKLVLHGAERVKLTERAFDIFWVLVEADGECVTKDTLLARIWGDEVVEENNLQAHISAIRRALGPRRDLIVTEFGRGYRVNRPAQAAATTLRLPAQFVAPSPLPMARTPTIGRDRDLHALVRLLDRNRIVTIAGAGGVGKTRLALEAARACVDEFEGRVYFVEMAAVATPETVWPALAEALGFEPTSGEPAPEALAALHGQRMLLVLDNCEHVVEQVSRIVEQVCRIAPHIDILATSQQALNADGEYVYRLAPLPAPPVDALTKAAALEYPSVQLLLERVSAHSHDFSCDDGEAAAVASICRQLDGVPLAIELAAARIPALGIQGVLNGLTDRFRLLTGGRRHAPHRHQTLHATVTWSVGLLNDDERRLLYGLSAFASAFTIEAAHAVVGFGGDHWQTADLLASLVQKSLLQTDFAGRFVRYRLLETLREYAREQLSSSGDLHGVRLRHAAWFLARSRQALADWKRMSTRDWRAAYRHDASDVRSVLSRTLGEATSRDAGIELLATAIPFWVEFSMLEDCRHWVSLALDNPLGVEAHREMALRAALGISLTWSRGPIPETGTAWTRTLTLAHTTGDSETELLAHYGLWLYGLRTRNPDMALREANAMLAMANAMEDNEALAVAKRVVGISLLAGGDLSEARELIETSLRWHASHPPFAPFRFGLGQHAAGLAFLARALWLQGHGEEALSTAAQAVEQATGLDHACTLCCVLAEGLCMVAMLDRDVGTVEASSRTLIETAARHGLQFWKTYGELFEVWALAQTAPAKLTADRALALVATLERTCFDVYYTPILLDLTNDARLAPGVRQILRAAVHAGGEAPTRHWAAPEFMRLAAATASNDAAIDASGTERRLMKALDRARASGMVAWELRIVLDLARRLADQDRSHEARRLVEAMLLHMPEGQKMPTDWRELQALSGILST